MALLRSRSAKYSTGVFLLILLLCHTAQAQVTRYLNDGNKLYGQQRFKEATADYAKAVAKNPTYAPGLFNLGNSLYQEKKFDSSRKIMEATAKMTNDKGSKAAANYNIGNTYMSQQKWEDAINAYKHTLRNNPQDGDAKYNLSYAEQMLKKQPDQDKKDKKDKDKQDKDKDKKDKDKDKKDKDKDKKDQNKDQDKDKKDKDKPDPQGDKDDKNKDDQHPQGQPSKLSQQQAEQLLNALQQEEKKLQDKMKKEKGVPVKMQKDW